MFYSFQMNSTVNSCTVHRMRPAFTLNCSKKMRNFTFQFSIENQILNNYCHNTFHSVGKNVQWEPFAQLTTKFLQPAVTKSVLNSYFRNNLFFMIIF